MARGKKKTGAEISQQLAEGLQGLDAKNGTETQLAPAPESPPERMGAQLLTQLIDMLRSTSGTWDQLSKGQQDSKIGALRSKIRELAGEAIKSIKAGAYENAIVLIESITVKDGAKATITFDTKEAHALIDYVGSRGVLVLCNPEQFFKDADAIEGEDEQKKLPLDPPKPMAPGENLPPGVPPIRKLGDPDAPAGDGEGPIDPAPGPESPPAIV